jgi:hypothetical protein
MRLELTEAGFGVHRVALSEYRNWPILLLEPLPEDDVRGALSLGLGSDHGIRAVAVHRGGPCPGAPGPMRGGEPIEYFACTNG